MRVYLVRHGESENNLNGLWTGQMDTPLTEKGKNDARVAAKILSGIKFDRIFSSDLCRATETARIATGGCEPEATELLREANVGSITGTPIASLSKEKREELARIGYAEFGGETRATVLERIIEFKKYLETLECDTVIAFSHRGWILGFLSSVLGVENVRKNVICSNCAIGIFEYTDGTWKLYGWINGTVA